MAISAKDQEKANSSASLLSHRKMSAGIASVLLSATLWANKPSSANAAVDSTQEKSIDNSSQSNSAVATESGLTIQTADTANEDDTQTADSTPKLQESSSQTADVAAKPSETSENAASAVESDAGNETTADDESTNESSVSLSDISDDTNAENDPLDASSFFSSGTDSSLNADALVGASGVSTGDGDLTGQSDQAGQSDSDFSLSDLGSDGGLLTGGSSSTSSGGRLTLTTDGVDSVGDYQYAFTGKFAKPIVSSDDANWKVTTADDGSYNVTYTHAFQGTSDAFAPGDVSITLPGQAIDKSGKLFDVKLTLSGINFKTLANDGTDSQLSNGNPVTWTVFSVEKQSDGSGQIWLRTGQGGGTLSGNFDSDRDGTIGTQMNVKIEVVGASSGSVPLYFSDLDQPDKTVAATNSHSPYKLTDYVSLDLLRAPRTYTEQIGFLSGMVGNTHANMTMTAGIKQDGNTYYGTAESNDQTSTEFVQLANASSSSIHWAASNESTQILNPFGVSEIKKSIPNSDGNVEASDVSISHTVKRTIHYVVKGGTAQAPADKVDQVTFSGTKAADGTETWDGNKDFADVTSPAIKGYTADRTVVSNKDIAHDHADIVETVTYTPDVQKLDVTYHDDTTNKDLKKDEISDNTSTVATKDNSPYTTESSISSYKSQGYELASDDTDGKQLIFDDDSNKDQHFVVHLKHAISAKPISNDVSRTITYTMSDGSKAPAQVKDSIHFNGTQTIDNVTKAVTSTTVDPNQDFKDVTSPAVKGYTPDRKVVSDKNIAYNHENITENIVYKPDPQKATVTYVDQTTGKTLSVKTLNGVTNAKSGYTTKSSIQGYEDSGYVLVSDDIKGNEIVYDNDDAVDQSYTVVLTKKAEEGSSTDSEENNSEAPDETLNDDSSQKSDESIAIDENEGSGNVPETAEKVDKPAGTSDDDDVQNFNSDTVISTTPSADSTTSTSLDGDASLPPETAGESKAAASESPSQETASTSPSQGTSSASLSQGTASEAQASATASESKTATSASPSQRTTSEVQAQATSSASSAQKSASASPAQGTASESSAQGTANASPTLKLTSTSPVQATASESPVQKATSTSHAQKLASESTAQKASSASSPKETVNASLQQMQEQPLEGSQAEILPQTGNRANHGLESVGLLASAASLLTAAASLSRKIAKNRQ